MYLKACANYGLKEQDLFQVNDLYENKNLYMVVDNLFSLGGMVSFNPMPADKKFKFSFHRPRKSPGRDPHWASKSRMRTSGTSTRTLWRRASPWSGCSTGPTRGPARPGWRPMGPPGRSGSRVSDEEASWYRHGSRHTHSCFNHHGTTCNSPSHSRALNINILDSFGPPAE